MGERTRRGKLWMTGSLVVAMLALIVGSACSFQGETEEEEVPVTTTVEIATALDDGTVAIGAEGVAYGMYLGSMYGGITTETQPFAASGGVLWDGAQLQSRGLYRFNISDWAEADGDITFNATVAYAYGERGELSVYVVEDFGTLPGTQGTESSDMSTLWSGGEQLGAASTPGSGETVSVTVPAATVTEYASTDGYIAFMLKASGETNEATSALVPNAYILTCYEYASAYEGAGMPTVSWTS
jgi:hypothetical protein